MTTILHLQGIYHTRVKSEFERGALPKGVFRVGTLPNALELVCFRSKVGISNLHFLAIFLVSYNLLLFAQDQFRNSFELGLLLPA